MVTGRDRQLWWHTAAILAVVANCHRDPKKKALSARDLHPYYNRSGKGAMPVNRDTMDVFAAMFVTPAKAKEAEERMRRQQLQVQEITQRQRLRLVRAA